MRPCPVAGAVAAVAAAAAPVAAVAAAAVCPCPTRRAARAELDRVARVPARMRPPGARPRPAGRACRALPRAEWASPALLLVRWPAPAAPSRPMLPPSVAKRAPASMAVVWGAALAACRGSSTTLPSRPEVSRSAARAGRARGASLPSVAAGKLRTTPAQSTRRHRPAVPAAASPTRGAGTRFPTTRAIPGCQRGSPAPPIPRRRRQSAPAPDRPVAARCRPRRPPALASSPVLPARPHVRSVAPRVAARRRARPGRCATWIAAACKAATARPPALPGPNATWTARSRAPARCHAPAPTAPSRSARAAVP